MTRFVDRLEDAGLLNDRAQRSAIEDLKAERECDYYTLVERLDDGAVVVALCRWSERQPVCGARVGLAGETLVYVSEVIA